MASNQNREDWKAKLTSEQYEVLRNKATEKPFTGNFLHNEKKGTYVCVACGNELFSSAHKFDSGSGWPSFYDIEESGAVKLVDDTSHNMNRTEVICARCGGHLGHLFDDAYDQPTGKRFCINSISLDFKESDEK